jgi:hypothetical protein
VTEAAAFLAWLGAAVIVLADGRRGLALGLALTTAGFAVLAWLGGESLAAAAVLLGGGVAAAQRLRTGPDVWGVMAPGSTARVVLCIAGGLLALWISTSVMTGPGAPLRFAVLSGLGLMAARTVGEAENAALLTAIAALALSVGMVASLAAVNPGPAPFVAAALIAAGASFVKVREPSGA